MRVAAVVLAVLAGLSSLPLALSGYEWAAARGGGIVFYLLPAVSCAGAALALALPALSGLLLLSLGFFWFELGAEMHYGANVISVAVWSFNGAAGLLALAAWLRDGLFAARAGKVARRAAPDYRTADSGLPMPRARRLARPSASAAGGGRKRAIPEYSRSPDLQHALAEQDSWPNAGGADQPKARSAAPAGAAVED